MTGDRDYVDYLSDFVEYAEEAAGLLTAVPNADAVAADRRTFPLSIPSLSRFVFFLPFPQFFLCPSSAVLR
jgi:hypothetical protein